jgi:uncharacterized protein (TIGR02588 family)
VAEKKTKERADRTASDIPLLEWIAGGVGALVVGAMLVYLGIKAATWQGSQPPMLSVEATRVVAGNGSYVVEVEVRNGADATGANVQIEGTLQEGDREVETSQAQLAYVPGRAHRPAGLVFTHDPRQYELELRVTGFEAP